MWHTIHTIYNPYEMHYEDFSTDCEAMPNERSESYILRAFQINGNDTTYSSIDEIHNTIYLEIEFDYCNKRNILNWNNYVGWGSEFSQYEIFCSENSASFQKIGNSYFNDTIFYHENIDFNKNYNYYIKAIRSDNTESVSNYKNIITNDIDVPEYLVIDSLISNKKINFYFNVDKNSDTQRYILYKSSSKNGVYDSISGINQTTENLIELFDEYTEEKNFYFLSAIDYCGNEILRTDTVSNIELNVTKSNNNDKVNCLKWQNEENIEYIIVRCMSDDTKCSIIDISNNSYYNDNIQSVFENQFVNEVTSGQFCYYITQETDSFFNKSNIECVSYDETIFIANAFNPKSNIIENRTFKPKIAFISNYELIIYGHFGDIIFQTKNPSIGWNGNLPNGKLAERASYLYIIAYTDSFGNKIKKKGYISLVY